jgi:molecular chaperone Hsp33
VSELHKFIFEGLPVRGAIVVLDDAWQDMLSKRSESGQYPAPVQALLGEMAAAAVLMQANIKFNGALVLQVQGDGPLKMAVAEVQPDFAVRATGTLRGDVANDAVLSDMVNVNNQGRCAITLDPKDRLPGQQPYQGVVPLFDDHGEKINKLSDVLQHYMLQSEQLDTCLVLAADGVRAAGLLIQRLPLAGEGNLGGQAVSNEDGIGKSEDYNRIAMLASSLKSEELLGLNVEEILHRLFWEEPIARFIPPHGVDRPRFQCSCSVERVGNMLRSLGSDEIESIIAERGEVEVGCEFCGAKYKFDPVDSAQLFTQTSVTPPDALQ